MRTREALVLGIDTTSSRPGVALAARGLVLAASHVEPGGKARGERLADDLAGVLSSLNRDIDAVTGIAVAAGPGSYTGVRVGLALARGLAFKDSLPVVGLDSLEVLSLAACGETGGAGPRLAVADAGRERAYARLAAADGDVAEVNDGAGTAESWEDLIILASLDEDFATKVEAALSACGSGVAAPTLVADDEGLLARVLASLERAPRAWSPRLAPAARAEQVAIEGERRLDAGLGGPAAGVLPTYLAGSGARPNRHGVISRAKDGRTQSASASPSEE